MYVIERNLCFPNRVMIGSDDFNTIQEAII